LGWDSLDVTGRQTAREEANLPCTGSALRGKSGMTHEVQASLWQFYVASLLTVAWIAFLALMAAWQQ
jgi:hypothetical protein